MRILVVNGPNLNMLGTREREIYGVETLEEINRYIKYEVEKWDVELEFRQSNHEGGIIDILHAAYYSYMEGIVINPGAYTHYSYAIRDAVAAVGIPTVEVHLSDIYAREEFRHVSVIKDVCVHQITGLGQDGYVKAVEFLLQREKEQQ